MGIIYTTEIYLGPLAQTTTILIINATKETEFFYWQFPMSNVFYFQGLL